MFNSIIIEWCISKSSKQIKRWGEYQNEVHLFSLIDGGFYNSEDKFRFFDKKKSKIFTFLRLRETSKKLNALLKIFRYDLIYSRYLLFRPYLWTVLHDDSQKPENIWTRDPNKILDKMKSLSTNFLIYYTKGDEKIHENLLKNFDVLEIINWEIFLNDLLIDTDNKFLKWHLLKKIN
jgi:hypothetical protein